MSHTTAPALVECKQKVPLGRSPLQTLGDHGQPVAFGCSKDGPELFFSLLELAKNRFVQTGIQQSGPIVWIRARAARHQSRLHVVPIE